MNKSGIKYALFYRSENHDRVYNTDSMEYWLKKFFTTGVFVGEFMVTANGGMSVKLGAGYVNIGGKVKVYLDDQELLLETAHATYDRIDSIVLERNDSDRDIFVKVVKGGYSSNPTPLIPIRENGVDQRVVAQIYVAHGAVKITQADITDTRTDTFLCGMVVGTVKEMDFSQFTAQFEAFFAGYRENISEKFKEYLENADYYSNQFVAWVAAKKDEITTWQNQEADDFDKWVQNFVNQWESWILGETKSWKEEIINWFDNLKEKLSENAAVQLQLQIGNLNNLQTKEKGDLVTAINSLLLTYDETLAILGGVKTVTVTLSTDDGASVTGQSVTLFNVSSGESDTREYTEDGISFEVYGGVEYILTAEDMEYYITPVKNIIINDGDELIVDLRYKMKGLDGLPWSKIIEISDNGNASEIFNLHDAKEIELTTGNKITVEIVGFNHDILTSDESKTAGITFGMKVCLNNGPDLSYKMNDDDDTNAGGWKECTMRTTTLREYLYDELPEELKAGIKTVNKRTTMGNTNYMVEETADDVWLFSAVELGITKPSTWVSTFEGETYPVFVDDESRKRPNAYGYFEPYWTRSPALNSSVRYNFIDISGINSIDNAMTALYVIAGFCV